LVEILFLFLEELVKPDLTHRLIVE